MYNRRILLRSSFPVADPNRIGSGVGFYDQNNRLTEASTIAMAPPHNCTTIPSGFPSDKIVAIMGA